MAKKKTNIGAFLFLKTTPKKDQADTLKATTKEFHAEKAI